MQPICSTTASALTDLARGSEFSTLSLKVSAGLLDTVIQKQAQEDGRAYVGHRHGAELAGLSPATFRKTLTLPLPWITVEAEGQAGAWEKGHPVATAFTATPAAASDTNTAPLHLVDPRHSLWRSGKAPGPLAWRVLIASASQPFTTAQARCWLIGDRVTPRTVTLVLNRLRDALLLKKTDHGHWTWNEAALDLYADEDYLRPSSSYDSDALEQEAFDTWHRERLERQNHVPQELPEPEKVVALDVETPEEAEARRKASMAFLQRIKAHQ